MPDMEMSTGYCHLRVFIPVSGCVYEEGESKVVGFSISAFEMEIEC
jgi:hypothetical protein